MGLRINTNIASIQGIRNMRMRTGKVNHSLSQLSSGERITKSADDAAGLAISQKLKAAIRGYKVAKRTALDGISMIQTAEGGLSEISNILIRLRELSVQAASDTIGPQERNFVQMEFTSLSKEMDRIALSTDFNGITLLQGDGGSGVVGNVDFQVGIKNRALIDRIGFDPKFANATSQALSIDKTKVADKRSAQESLAIIDAATVSVSEMRAHFGALQNRIQSTINNTSVMIENMSAANSRIRDADVAEVSSALAKDTILQQASAAVLAQANASGEIALQLIQNIR